MNVPNRPGQAGSNGLYNTTGCRGANGQTRGKGEES